jgi:dTDP-4-dehydrorhamnose 3,5-epimerase
MLQIDSLDIPDVRVIRPGRVNDARGFFSEVYNASVLRDVGIHAEFVQDNHSLSRQTGTIRGLHFQIPPYAQAKLLRVLRGSIFDVAVDIRRGSPSFGKHVSAIISATEWNQIYIPAGFAHGFCTLEAETEVLYKVTAYYSAAHDLGLRWDDPQLAIEWPAVAANPILSEKDRRQPRLAELPDYFSNP